jgi:hypothetical protein
MTAEPHTVAPETFAQELSARMLSCRELGHVWVPWSVEVVQERRRIGGYLRTMKCKQCRAERRQVLDSGAHVVSNSYTYPDGYLATNVERGVSRDVFRMEAISRWLDSHEAAVAS